MGEDDRVTDEYTHQKDRCRGVVSKKIVHYPSSQFPPRPISKLEFKRISHIKSVISNGVSYSVTCLFTLSTVT